MKEMSPVHYCLLVSVSILDVVFAECSNETSMWNEPQKERHPCNRICIEGETMTCHYEFVIEKYLSMSKACYNCSLNQSDCFRPDCVAVDGNTRSICSVNRMISGPLIEVCHGDKLVIKVINQMNDETTSIHWHGMLQQGTPYMDGVPMVTQCPIAPGQTFYYEYWADDHGTHLYHGHTGTQRVDGLYGGIIVRRPDSKTPHRELYDYDEHCMVLSDWALNSGIDKVLLNLHKGGGNSGTGILCNGRGRYINDTEQKSNTPLQVYHVKQGKRYRFRLVMAGSYACPIRCSIDNHTMLAIACDGNDIKPKAVDSQVCYQGERWDFILDANQTNATYWIRFKGLEACAGSRAHGVAILKYEESDCVEPSEPIGYDLGPTPNLEMNCVNVDDNQTGCVDVDQLQTYERSAKDERECNALQEEVQCKIVLPFDFSTVDNPISHRLPYYGYNQVNASMRAFTPQLNNVSFRTPNVPPLSQPCDLDKTRFCTEEDFKTNGTEYRECTTMFELEYGHPCELILVNLGQYINATHPFHLHGHAFRVVKMGKIGSSCSVDDVMQLDKEGKIERNLQDAPYKDVVTTPDGGYTILRFCPINHGVWFFHCHIEIHLESKMACMFKVGDVKDYPPVPKDFPKCGIYHDEERQSCSYDDGTTFSANFNLNIKFNG